MADKRRVFKVAEKIRGILSLHLHRVSDPTFGMMTITSVVVSSDLRIAKVYWTVTGGAERIEEVERTLTEQNSQFRRALAGQLGTRVVPELKFFYDETMDEVEHVAQLLAKIRPPAQDEQ